MTLKYENTAKVGDVIKAYDFEPMPGRPDRYVIGAVADKGTFDGYFFGKVKAYRLDKYTRIRREGKVVTKRIEVEDNPIYVPFETTDDYEGRIRVETYKVDGLVIEDIKDAFKGKAYAFAPVVDDDGFGIGVAVANEKGYMRVPKYVAGSYGEAAAEADRLNADVLGYNDIAATRIVASTF